MKRPFIIGLALAGAAAAALPATLLGIVPGIGGLEATASAAGSVPPGPPMVLYGAAPGIPGGTSVSVGNVSTGASCGRGSVISDSGSTYYVVDVVADSQVTGCGTSGSTMTLALYFAPSAPGTGGRVATVNVTWSVSGTKQDASPGSPLPITGIASELARDGVN